MAIDKYCCNFGRELATKETLLFEGKNFFVCSAVGQMGIEGYLQLCPKEHIPGYGLLSAELDSEFEAVLARTKEVLKSVYGTRSVVFENGPSKEKKTGSPRIQHSHIHVIPHDNIDIHKILREVGNPVGIQDLKPLRRSLAKGKSYIFAETQEGKRYLLEQPSDYSSKIMRSLIGKQIGVSNTHWRDNLDMPTYHNTINRLMGKFSSLKG